MVDADFSVAQGSGIMDAFLLVGFLIGLYVVPRFGRMRMQIVGFIGMTAGMLILAIATVLTQGASHHVPLVFAGFILFNLLMNMGPNSTTFTLPAELFPTHVRASGSGFAAASGKVGATLGIFFLPLIKASFGVTMVLCVVAVVSALGFVVTLAFSEETGEVSLEELHKTSST
jgi:MFS transporter, putative metabolite transport protein